MPTPRGPRAPLSLCFGGGGAFGYGFNMGVAEGLRDRGLDLAGFPMVGTSAGSHTAASIENGLMFDEVADIWQRFVDERGRRVSRGIDLAGPIYGDLAADDVGAVAVRMLTLRRHVLSSDDHRLADIVAASSSVPPLVWPHKIDGKRWLDGGVVSLASIDLTPGAELLLAITPMAIREQGVVGRVAGFQARREIRRWVDEHGGSVLHVVPTPEMVAFGGTRLREVGDMTIGRAVYPLAIELGHQVGDVLRADHPSLFSEGASRQSASTGGR